MSDADSSSGTDLRTLFYSVAATMRGGALTAGDLAGLRRMDPARLDAPAFWKVAGLHLDHVLPGNSDARARLETAWAAVIVALAALGDLQARDARLGTALARAGYSEPRFVRLLRADHERLVDEIPQLARYLVAKQTAADLVDTAALLLNASPESARRRLARDYYSNPPDSA